MYPRYIVNFSMFKKGMSIFSYTEPGWGREYIVGRERYTSERISLTPIEDTTRNGVWVEVSRDGFDRVVAWADIDSDSLSRDQAREYIKPYLVYPKPPPTNHKIGVPKNKLP